MARQTKPELRQQECELRASDNSKGGCALLTTAEGRFTAGLPESRFRCATPNAGAKTMAADSMKDANVSTCANPQCGQEFKRLGEGKLFVRPAEKNDTGLTQKALWLCQACAEHFDLRYDRRRQEFHLIRHRRAA